MSASLNNVEQTQTRRTGREVFGHFVNRASAASRILLRMRSWENYVFLEGH